MNRSKKRAKISESGSPSSSTIVLEVDDTSLNNSDAESDDSDGCISADFRNEEKRLRRLRESVESRTPVPQDVESLLPNRRFDELNTLLDRSEICTKLIREQIEKMEEEQLRKESDEELLPLMTAPLRSYQVKGVRWLISSYRNGIDGILADEMGLGKTIQTIGFLSHLRYNGILGPFMVVAPLSTLGNWVMEFKKWAPALPAVMYHGNKEERKCLQLKLSGPVTSDFPVIVTTYEITMNDLSFLKKFCFKSLVIDEGHRLKNYKCKLLRCLKEIKADNRVLLTGTPLQNSLSELWSILNFILPDTFSELDAFEKWFDFSQVGQVQGQEALVAAEQRDRVVSKLHSILRPFFLRRLKSDVEIELPAKQEIVLYAHMTPYQQKINQGILDKSLFAKLEREVKTKAVRGLAKGKLRQICMQMRKNCNHPDLITGGYDGALEYPPVSVLLDQCGKLQLLDRLLQKLKANGHKVLIFSQMRRMLDILEYYLTENGEEPCRLDGSVKVAERQLHMERFNTDSSLWLFLLTTTAGGLGINLTAADTVIIYDSDWNPQQDLQAMDRCHRIGQSRPVLVFRLVTGHSVEGRMLKRASSKIVLERLVMKKGAFQGDHFVSDIPSTSLTVEEILPLLRSDVSLEDDIQSKVVCDKSLDRLLNRTHLLTKETSAKLPYPRSNPGYEVVVKSDNATILPSINKD